MGRRIETVVKCLLGMVEPQPVVLGKECQVIGDADCRGIIEKLFADELYNIANPGGEMRSEQDHFRSARQRSLKVCVKSSASRCAVQALKALLPAALLLHTRYLISVQLRLAFRQHAPRQFLLPGSVAAFHGLVAVVEQQFMQVDLHRADFRAIAAPGKKHS